MHSAAEGSPLLRGAKGLMSGYTEEANEHSSSRGGRTSSRSSDRNRQGHGRLRSQSPSRKTWTGMMKGGKSGMAGLVMFALAFAGLAAIFYSIQDSRTPRSSDGLQEMKEAPGMRGSEGDEGAGAEKNAAGGRSHGARGDTMATAVGVFSAGSPSKNRDQDEALPDPQQQQQQQQEQRHEGLGPFEVDGQSRDTEGASTNANGQGPDLEGEMAGDEADDSGTSKPNVIFIMIDDMGWNDIGYQSTDLADVTPNLDRLASLGVKMTQYYTMSICTPARASLMTGRYPIRYGLQYNVIQPGAPWGLPLTEKLFPQYMNDAGYESHMVGKWHIGSYTHAHAPYQRGFDTYLGYLNDEEMYWTHQSWTARLHGRKFFDFGFGNSTGYYDVIERSSAPIMEVDDDTDDGDDDGSDTGDDYDITTGPTSELSSSSTIDFKGKYSTTVFQERAMEILKYKQPDDENPLFLYLAHQAVHDPLGIPPAEVFTEEEWAIIDAIDGKTDYNTLRKRFAKVLMYMDKTIGELVDYLEEAGWMENSIIVIASDNGGCPSKGGSNYPLRGIKHSYWEGGTKVPAFVYSPSHIPESRWGTEYSGLMHVTDWLPTLASVAGVELQGNFGEFDGIDHWSYITDPDRADSTESPRHEMLYNWDPYVLWTDGDSILEAEYPIAQGAFRQGKWKLTLNEWCSGWYTFDRDIYDEDGLVNSTTTCLELGECDDCGMSCLNSGNYTDWLFDLEDDPREERNVAHLYPEVVDEMRGRMLEIVFEEYSNASYADIDTDAYYVWARYDWWMVPWYMLAANATEDPFGLGSDDGSSSVSWTSTVSS